MSKEKPSITFITVTYQDREALRSTLDSVKSQSDLDFEYIVIDGGSKDGTSRMVRSFNDVIDLFVTERDSGIYDAMNKGLKRASKDFLIFLNAGDVLFDSGVVEKIKEAINYSDEVVLFPCVSKDRVLLNSYRGDFEKILWESYGCHQGYVIRTSLLKGTQFDVRYKIKADRALIANLYTQGKKFRYNKEFPICVYDTDGISHQKIFRKELENILISWRQPGLKKSKTFFISLTKIALFGISKILPFNWVNIKKYFNERR